MMIEYHADDFGASEGAARRMIDCINRGKLNGISLMPNAPAFNKCMEIFKAECKKKVRLSVHLNIMTERPLSDPADIPDLVDDSGFFNMSYMKLIKACLIPSLGKRLRKEIKAELSKQINACLPYIPEEEGLRLDSHRHFHMVPLVFSVIDEIVREEGLNLSYIRIIREKPYLYRGLAGFQHFRAVNIVKVILLDLFSVIDSIGWRELWNRGNGVFGSILFSGCMTKRNVKLILKNIERNPASQGKDIELMFHPGAVTDPEELQMIHDPEDRAYMSDPLRFKEGEALMQST